VVLFCVHVFGNGAYRWSAGELQAAEIDCTRLTGWMKNSQAFFGEGKVRVVSSLATEDPSCR
jgi:hypothetical protein